MHIYVKLVYKCVTIYETHYKVLRSLPSPQSLVINTAI